MITLRVLIVEDSENDAALLLMELRRGNWQIHHQRVDTAEAMTAALNEGHWDIIIADYSMPRFSGPAALKMARESAVYIPFILVSGTVGEATAVAAMKAGADDYFFKGDLNRVVPAVERELRAMEDRRRARKVEHLLHAREKQLADALRLARLGTWHFDLNAGLADWSDEACSLLGRAPSDEAPTFEQFLACMHPEDRAAFVADFDNKTISRIAQDCRLIHADAQVMYVHIRGTLTRDESGKPTVAGGMIQDITERKLIDAELLRLKDAAEAANRAKSEFLANMSHELRTPMSAILGFADIMMSEPGKHALDPTECIQVIRRNSNHLLELINEILDLSKIESGHMTVESIECDLPQLLTDVTSLMQARAAEKSVQFNVKIDGQIPRFITTDSTKLRQILVNLVGNAIKFTAAGSIEIMVGCKLADQFNMLRIEIRDTGIGMTSEQLGRVFEPFAQAEHSTTRKFGGTGLGLAISRRLARLLNGDITVTSISGQGSAFTLSIEANCENDVEWLTKLENNSVPVAPEGNTGDASICAHVLLAEDGKDNQRLLSTHLKSAGAQVDIAENGAIAVDQATSHPFDIILMDMQMPVMDGYTATTELRRRGITTPIIALTAYAMSEDRKKCLDAGCTDYLTKPVDKAKLLAAIRRHLEHSKGDALIDHDPIPMPVGSPAEPELLRSTLINYPGMAAIIVEFVRDLPGHVEQLRLLLSQKRLDELARVIHQLRGACGGYGFDAITDLAADAEDSIKSGKPLVEISDSVKSLIHIIQRVEGYDRRESRQAA